MEILKDNMALIEKEIIEPMRENPKINSELETEIIKAIKKQIPIKLDIREWTPVKCPTCGAELSESLGDGYYKYYTNKKRCECGQRLDWSIR